MKTPDQIFAPYSTIRIDWASLSQIRSSSVNMKRSALTNRTGL